MNTTIQMDNCSQIKTDNPGAQLAQIREKKGYSREYVAGKLHLRVRLIELLETDSYDQMPETVFIKGYFRAYAKLLEVPPEPFLELFTSLHTVERKTEKTLWQGKRETYRKAKIVRWVTAMIVVGAIVTVGMWWHNNADSPLFISNTVSKSDINETSSGKTTDGPLTEVSKLQSLFQMSTESSQPEKKVG